MIEDAELAYRRRTPGSERHAEHARDLLPGGVSANSKFFSPYPPVMQRARGAYLWDVDDNRYIDYLLVFGAIILGHAHPAVEDAIAVQLQTAGGLVFGTSHPGELRMANTLRRLFPTAERVRFTNSGLEATLLCLRLAAAYTRRVGVAKFEGHYHGAHDQVLVSYAPREADAGSPSEPTPVADSRGLPGDVLERTLVLPWNDIESTRRLLRLHARTVGALILEPLLGGYIPPEPGFLEELRRVSQELDMLLVFDEVKTGFRLALGGAQEYFGIRADLTALGKILGGGFPVGAVVGRADVMEQAAPAASGEGVFHSGTYNGHPTIMAAGHAVLSALETPGTYARLENLANELKSRIAAAARRRGVGIETPGLGSTFGVVFADHPPRNYRDLCHADHTRRRLLDLRLLARGIYFRPGDRFNLSLAHTEADVEATAEAIEAALSS